MSNSFESELTNKVIASIGLDKPLAKGYGTFEYESPMEEEEILSISIRNGHLYLDLGWLASKFDECGIDITREIALVSDFVTDVVEKRVNNFRISWEK